MRCCLLYGAVKVVVRVVPHWPIANGALRTRGHMTGGRCKCLDMFSMYGLFITLKQEFGSSGAFTIGSSYLLNGFMQVRPLLVT